ncbi:MAG: hypothetical protein IJK11_03895 [Acidaminococcaceae bacterium]|nr:hypothetical protein [Acidaminococcaceae bacterium]
MCKVRRTASGGATATCACSPGGMGVQRRRKVTKRLGVGQNGRGESTRVPDCVQVESDSERRLLRYEQKLSGLAEERHPVNFYKNFSLCHINKSYERKMCLGDFSGPDVP